MKEPARALGTSLLLAVVLAFGLSLDDPQPAAFCGCPDCLTEVRAGPGLQKDLPGPLNTLGLR